jgi:hypothetical protein
MKTEIAHTLFWLLAITIVLAVLDECTTPRFPHHETTKQQAADSPFTGDRQRHRP